MNASDTELTAQELARQSLVCCMAFAAFKPNLRRGDKTLRLVFMHESHAENEASLQEVERLGLKFVGYCGWSGRKILHICLGTDADSQELFGACVCLFASRLFQLARTMRAASEAAQA